MRAYVIENNCLVERLQLPHPLPEVHLAIKRELTASFQQEESDVMPSSAYENTTYKCLFRSVANKVMVYSNDDPLSFMERALREIPISSNRRFMFQPYQIEAKLTYSNRETLKELVLEAIRMARQQRSDGGDSYIAERAASQIDIYYRNGQ